MKKMKLKKREVQGCNGLGNAFFFFRLTNKHLSPCFPFSLQQHNFAGTIFALLAAATHCLPLPSAAAPPRQFTPTTVFDILSQSQPINTSSTTTLLNENLP